MGVTQKEYPHILKEMLFFVDPDSIIRKGGEGDFFSCMDVLEVMAWNLKNQRMVPLIERIMFFIIVEG